MSKNRETLTVIVNGRAVEVEVNDNAPLHTLITKALAESHNTGQPPENWELRDQDGNVLDRDRKIGDFHFAAGALLSLTLKSGIGG